MKKNLLYLILPMLFTAFSVNAQTSKVWDFGADAATWGVANTAMATGINTVIDKLGLNAGVGVATFGAVQSSNTTFADNTKTTACIKMGGAGISTLPLTDPHYFDADGYFKPDQRFLYFAVTGPCTVKVWFKTSSTNSLRGAILTNGVDFKAYATTTTAEILTADYKGGAGTLYLYTDTGANFYKIEVIANGATGLGNTTTLGTNTFNKESDVTVYSNNNKVFFSKIKSKTNVAIYSLTGALVKSAVVNEDSGLDVENGVYIVKLQSAEGEKTVKVIVQ